MSKQQFSTSQPDLKAEIETFSQHYLRLHRGNWRINAALVLIGLLLSAGVTVAGMFNQGVVAALLGVAIALLIGVQNAFPMGDKAEFYRLIVAESQNLLSDLKYKVNSNAEFEDVLARFQTLRKYAAASLPRGQGMETVKNMYKELSGERD